MITLVWLAIFFLGAKVLVCALDYWLTRNGDKVRW